ncbi:hypothetical protein NQZ68_013603 [Dissostichus eleginoides]|nr:hypothetical protein NQZ68_013603 [Dissostichus eleginoides]
MIDMEGRQLDLDSIKERKVFGLISPDEEKLEVQTPGPPPLPGVERLGEGPGDMAASSGSSWSHRRVKSFNIHLHWRYLRGTGEHQLCPPICCGDRPEHLDPLKKLGEKQQQAKRQLVRVWLSV